jgi:hypothetical protein
MNNQYSYYLLYFYYFSTEVYLFSFLEYRDNIYVVLLVWIENNHYNTFLFSTCDAPQMWLLNIVSTSLNVLFIYMQSHLYILKELMETLVSSSKISSYLQFI